MISRSCAPLATRRPSGRVLPPGLQWRLCVRIKSFVPQSKTPFSAPLRVAVSHPRVPVTRLKLCASTDFGEVPGWLFAASHVANRLAKGGSTLCLPAPSTTPPVPAVRLI